MLLSYSPDGGVTFFLTRGYPRISPKTLHHVIFVSNVFRVHGGLNSLSNRKSPFEQQH